MVRLSVFIPYSMWCWYECNICNIIYNALYIGDIIMKRKFQRAQVMKQNDLARRNLVRERVANEKAHIILMNKDKTKGIKLWVV